MNRFFYSILILMVVMGVCNCPASAAEVGTYPKIEASFDLASVTGNPFDYTQNNVMVILRCPDGSDLRLPAFFDGGQTWRVRHAPQAPGTYTIRTVLLNGNSVQPANLTPDHFDVEGNPGPGFVRIPANDKSRFQFDNGKPYYPIGYDLAWQRDGEPSVPEALEVMGKARANWSRIWMCSWDGKALDWFQNPDDQPALGTFSFLAIKKWDQIVDAAEANHVYFQMTLQQHGQYSTHADDNWHINPWNKANGGWMDNAAEFFTDPKAIALTKSKYRYIIARWGYSPSIMAFELFNEVESADAFKSDLDSVGRWHAEMASFIRKQDIYHHLITTSSVTTEPKLWPAMDYYQCHAYPPDLLLAIEDLDSQHLHKPFFYGEIGSSTFDGDPDPGDTIHRVLWGSLMSQSAGAAQYWFWELIAARHNLSNYTTAVEFLEKSGLLNQRNLKPISVAVETTSRGPLKFGPAIGWANSKSTHFVLNPDGTTDGVSGMSAFLQGDSSLRAMFPMADFDVNYITPGTFAVRFDQITAAGAKVGVTVDHTLVATMSVAYPGNASGHSHGDSQDPPKIDQTIEIPITAGPHQIQVENTGKDWIHIRSFTLTPYAPALAALGKASSDYAVVWVYRRSQAQREPVTGTLKIPGLQEGSYTATWWDTHRGAVIQSDELHVETGHSLLLKTPAVADDAAVCITRDPG